MAEKEPSSFRLIATLVVAGVVSGVLLVSSYLWTLPQIQRNKAAALQAAVFRLLPGTTKMVPYVVDNDALKVYQRQGDELPSSDAVFAGFNAEGKLVGYAIPADGPGFADTIRVLYGFDADRRTIVGMEILDSKETPGLGDKIIDDKEFHASLKALKVEPSIVLQKRGVPQAPNEVDAISGATISSDAIVKLLNKSTKRWLPLFAKPLVTSQKD